MKCIYCLRESSRSRSVAHAVAEALYPHGPVMPPGAICDHCNHYFGANLESMLVQHPAIALPMQLHGLPGKTGKPRAKLGTFERDVEPGYSITFPSTKP